MLVGQLIEQNQTETFLTFLFEIHFSIHIKEKKAVFLLISVTVVPFARCAVGDKKLAAGRTAQQLCLCFYPEICLSGSPKFMGLNSIKCLNYLLYS